VLARLWKSRYRTDNSGKAPGQGNVRHESTSKEDREKTNEDFALPFSTWRRCPVQQLKGPLAADAEELADLG
jgi:hypothetical protein